MKTSLNLAGIPTAERFIQSDGYVEVGGDDREGRVYRFKDTALARTYADLNARATDDQRKVNEAELRALTKYYDSYVGGGLNGSMRSVDLDNACVSSSSRDHAAKSDWQLDNRAAFHQANIRLNWYPNQLLVTRIVVLEDCSLEQAGRALGKLSRRRAIQSAQDILRKAGNALADMWKMI